MKNATKPAITLALTLSLLASTMAQQAPRVYREGNAWVEEVTGTLPAARNLRVDTHVGTVRVTGGAGGTITYVIKKRAFQSSEERARREFETFRVLGSRMGETAVLRGEVNQGNNPKLTIEINIQSPRELDVVTVQTRGGGIDIRNIAGRIDAETFGGSITLDAIGSIINARTAGGDISLGNGGGDAILKSAGGQVRVESVSGRLLATTYGGGVQVGTANQAATLESMGGSIRIRKVGGDLRATTAGGDVEAGEVGGMAYLKTAGGNIRLASARGLVDAATAGGSVSLWKLERGARAQTAAGAITAEFLGNAFSDSVLRTTAGDIKVFLAPRITCSVKASIEMASGHRINAAEFPEVKIITQSAPFGPGQVDAQGMLNGGGPQLKLVTSIGDIDIKKVAGH